MHEVILHRPAALTKELALKTCAYHGRKVVIESNFLDLYGFRPMARYERRVLGAGGRGFALSLRDGGVQQIYRRAMPNRRSNPFRTVLDIGARGFLDQSLPGWTERVHITFRHGELEVRPTPNHTFHIRKSFRRSASPLSSFVGFTGGVDATCMEKLGFRITGMAEWRPPEARDTSDLTESGVLTSLSNCHPGVVFNEDITRLDMTRVRAAIEQDLPIGCLALSLPCYEFSSLKGASLKRRAIADGTSSRDLVYDALRMAEALRPVTLVIENVAPFASSPECDLISVRLRRWGYEVSTAILDARDFGGYTSRRRTFLVASLFPGFAFPTPGPRRTTPIWPEFADEIARCRDVSHLKAPQKGAATGRAIMWTPESLHAATVVRSQAHQASDALYLKTADGRYLLPTEAMLKRLNSIPESFNLSAVSEAVGIETIGQSICVRMHDALLSKIREHLLLNHTKTAREPVASLCVAAQLEMELA
jgi:DNA (cytosine-5)-methyltransferase 1